MRTSIYFLAVLFAMLFSSCEPAVVFTEPQPQDFNRLSSFDMMYRGAFQCESDSSIVHVTSKSIYKERTYPFVLTEEMIKTMKGVKVLRKHLYIDSLNLKLPVEMIGDSIYAEMIKRDTLFTITKEQVLKSFRGHQILNKKLDDGKWEVIILSMDYDMNLVLSIATYPEDLNRLEEITPVKDLSRGDTVQYQISPTVFEFDQILEEQLIFEACDYYIRIALPVEL